MNTPSHTILNIAILINPQLQQANLPIVLGAVLPDIPMFVLYFWAKFIRRLPERQIWTETYYETFWQNLTDSFHSIPIALVGLVLAYYFRWEQLTILFISVLLHSAFDLPVHNDDAHRHFFPLSDYRFISPVSYWDPKHYGRIFSKIEVLLVLAASYYIFPMLQSYFSRGLVLVVNLLYLTRFIFSFYLSIVAVVNQKGN